MAAELYMFSQTLLIYSLLRETGSWVKVLHGNFPVGWGGLSKPAGNSQKVLV